MRTRQKKDVDSSYCINNVQSRIITSFCGIVTESATLVFLISDQAPHREGIHRAAII